MHALIALLLLAPVQAADGRLNVRIEDPSDPDSTMTFTVIRGTEIHLLPSGTVVVRVPGTWEDAAPLAPPTSPPAPADPAPPEAVVEAAPLPEAPVLVEEVLGSDAPPVVGAIVEVPVAAALSPSDEVSERPATRHADPPDPIPAARVPEPVTRETAPGPTGAVPRLPE